jgi:hypothetical protein
VQDIFLTETAQLAHVVLPGTAFVEKDGTFGWHRIILKKTLKDVFGPSMVSGGCSLKDGYSTTGLGCDRYHILNYTLVEKNGALFGMRNLLTLAPIPHRNLIQISLNIVNSMYCLKGGLLRFMAPAARPDSVAAVVNYV